MKAEKPIAMDYSSQNEEDTPLLADSGTSFLQDISQTSQKYEHKPKKGNKKHEQKETPQTKKTFKNDILSDDEVPMILQTATTGDETCVQLKYDDDSEDIS